MRKKKKLSELKQALRDIDWMELEEKAMKIAVAVLIVEAVFLSTAAIILVIARLSKLL